MGIKPVVLQDRGMTVNGKTVYYTGLGPNARISAFDLNGNLVKTIHVSGSGAIAMEAIFGTKGTYILRLSDKNLNRTVRIQR